MAEEMQAAVLVIIQLTAFKNSKLPVNTLTLQSFLRPALSTEPMMSTKMRIRPELQ